MFESRISAGATEKLQCSENIRISSWSYDMEGHAKKRVERYCESANKTTQQLYKVSTPCIDDNQSKEELKSVEELSKVCSQIVLKCLYMARIGRPDILWSVNKVARFITKWTKACDKRLNRLISYIHHTCEYKQYCYVGNTAKQCRLGLFQDSDFAWDLEALKIYFKWNIVHFRKPHVRSNQLWMCKKQTSVSHSSTESEIISLDAGMRMGGIPALDLWDLIVAVLHGNTNQSKHVQGDLSTSLTRNKIPGKIDDLNNVVFVSSNANSSRKEAMLYIFEDNEVVIKMIINGRSPTMGHVSRIHGVALDWLFGRINLHPKIQIKYIDTKNQLADTLTKGSFTRDEWNHVLCLFNISHFSSTDYSAVMSKRTRKRFRWRKSHSKVETDDEFGIKMPCEGSNRACLDCIWKPGEHQIWKWGSTSEFVECAATGTGRPVVLAGSSNSSEWNNDDKWSSQVRKSGEMSRTSTGRPASNKLVIDIDMGSDTAAESNLYLKSRSFFNRVNDRLRKMLSRSPEDSMQDIDKRSTIWWMDLDQKRSGILLILTDHKENGTESQNPWWSDSEKADTQFSEPRVHCPEERSKVKDVDNYQYTIAPMGERLKLFSLDYFC